MKNTFTNRIFSAIFHHVVLVKNCPIYSKSFAVAYSTSRIQRSKWHFLFYSALVLLCNTAIAQPTISNVSPYKGAPGTSVTITGTNFNTTASNNVVYFGATRANVTGATATTLNVTVPLGATYMPVFVENTTTQLSGYSKYAFLPTFDNSHNIVDTFNFPHRFHLVDDSLEDNGLVCVFDVDGDGKPDLVIPNGWGAVSIYRNISTSGTIDASSFAPRVNVHLNEQEENSPTKVAFGDLDGDGKPDMAVVGANFWDMITLVRNTSTPGNISFATGHYIYFPNPKQIAIADMNGDGKPELIIGGGQVADTAYTRESVTIFQNIATPGTLDWTSFAVDSTFIEMLPYGSVDDMKIADIDGDGFPDVVITNDLLNAVSVFHNNGGTGLITRASFGSSIDMHFHNYFYSFNKRVAVGDLDGDGKPDIAVCNNDENRLIIYRNLSSAGSLSASSFADSVGFTAGLYGADGPYDIAMADFNGDGKTDIAVTNEWTTIGLYRNVCTPGSITSSSFVTSNIFTSHDDIPFQSYELAIGDIDGDGRPDILIRADSSEHIDLFIYRNVALFPIAPITGANIVCVGSTIGLADDSTGGTWTSSNTAIATVGGGSGIVTGVSAGVDTITYTIASGGVATMTITVNAIPTPIIGSQFVCIGSTSALSEVALGGIWGSSNTSIATVDPLTGVVSGLSAGPTTIAYSNGCGAAITTTVTASGYPTGSYNINPNPVCTGAPATFSSGETGTYVWAFGDGSVNSGTNPGPIHSYSLSGFYSPTLTITNPAGCSTSTHQFLPVTQLPLAITGTTAFCPGSAYILESYPFDGTWSSSNTLVATIDPGSGVVSGVMTGTTTISYTNGCAPSTTTVTIFPVPAGVYSVTPNPVCQGAVDTFSSGETGSYDWEFGDGTNNIGLSTNPTHSYSDAGIYTSYLVITNLLGCTTMATQTVVVNPLPSDINGRSAFCVGAMTMYLDDADGGIWSSSNTTVATIDPLVGSTIGIVAGSTTISYTTGCGVATMSLTISPAIPGIFTISSNPICQGVADTFTDLDAGFYFWVNGDGSTSSGSSISVHTYNDPGTYLVSLNVSNLLGCSTTTTQTLTVNPAPGNITGTLAILPGTTTTLANSFTGGVWSSTTTSVATIDNSGTAIGVSLGYTTISYTVTNSCNDTPVTHLVVSKVINTFAGMIPGSGGGIGIGGGDGGGRGLGLGGADPTDGAAARGASLQAVYSVAVDTGENVYFSEPFNHVIRKVNTSGILSTIAGTGNPDYSGDGSPASAAGLNTPAGIAVDRLGNLYIADQGNNVIRKISSSGVISTFAGNGSGGYSGDGGAAISASLNGPDGVAVDRFGNVYIGDLNNEVVRKVDLSGNISTIAGTPLNQGNAGDGGPATSAMLSSPTGVAIDNAGNLFIADRDNNLVREVNTSGIISTIAGNGGPFPGFHDFLDGDFGPATSAALNSPNSLIVDSMGNIYIADVGNRVVRVINPQGILLPYAAASQDGLAGDGGPAPLALMLYPTGIAMDRLHNLFIADKFNRDIRIVGILPSYTPSFTNGHLQMLGGCTDTDPISIDPLLTITDGNFPATETWSVISGPSHGSLDGFPSTASATGSQLTPSGTTYTPAPGYSGLDTFIIQIGDGAATNKDTIAVNISPAPDAGTINGLTEIVAGASTTFSDGALGGVWTSDDSTIASVNNTGVVTGVAAGSVNINYFVTNSCSIAVTSLTITVDPGALISQITGDTTVCVGSTMTLSDSTAGGLWSSSNLAIATIDENTGMVTGVSQGTDTITYALSADIFATMTITVIAAPGTVTGTTTICQGNATHLTDTAIGGTWSSSDPSVGSLYPIIPGLVTGSAPGITIISYATSCGTATTTVTVNPLPSAAPANDGPTCAGVPVTLFAAPAGNANMYSWTGPTGFTSSVQNPTVTPPATGIYSLTVSSSISGCSSFVVYTTTVSVIPPPSPITGVTSICNGTTTQLTDITGGGNWGSQSSSIALVNSSGVVTAQGVGSTTISYNVGGCLTTTTLTVNTQPQAITGTTSICNGTTTQLTDMTGGGNWGFVSSSIAIVNSSGLVSAQGVGATVISYTLGSCAATTTVTVNIRPAAITGATSLCNGATTQLSDITAGGNWGFVSSSIAIVNSGGLVTAQGIGSTVISYTIGSCAATTTVTVNTQPAAITGTTTVCNGASTQLTDATGGGNWGSQSSSIALVNSGGLVTAQGVGSTVISYTTGGCTTTTTVTVSTRPAAITGAMSICNGAATQLSDITGGGNWGAQSSSIALVNSSGLVTSQGIGSTTISYTIGSCAATATLTVNALPAAITGTTAICNGAATQLSDITGGGNWGSQSSSIALVNSSGMVTAQGVGSTVISYTLGSCAATTTVTVITRPAAITGNTTICNGATTQLGDITGGGNWGFVSSSIAIVSSGGLVTGEGVGSTVISYTIGSCAATTTVTVNTQPAAITGTTTVCNGSTTQLSDITGGGNWGSASTGIAIVGLSTGIATGESGGSAIISYSIGSCVATATVLVNPISPITGITSICSGSTTLNDGIAGGTWTSGSPSIATITSTGIVSGLSSGVAIITYKMSTGCQATTSVNIGSISPITGATVVCTGLTTTLNNSSPGGTWSSGSAGVASVGITSGVVKGITTGVANITYTIGTGCYTVTPITVMSGIASITGANAVCAGSATPLNDATTGGLWSTSASGIATVGSTGIVSGVSGGAAVISYAVGAGCVATTTVTVNPTPPITGTLAVCTGQTTMLSAGVAGGTWVSSNVGMATVVSTTGLVTGVSASAPVISYKLASGCVSNATVTVLSLAAITGIASVCQGQATTLADATTGGGTWSSSNTLMATVSSGIVTGTGAGTPTITFTSIAGCAATRPVTVLPLAPITGIMSVCMGQTTTLNDGVAGGTWVSSNVGMATVVSTTGVVTGVTVSAPVISYKLASGCVSNATVTVLSLAAITGIASVCQGQATTLADATTGGGTWSSSNTLMATVSSGIVTGTGAGTPTITFTSVGGCAATRPVTVLPLAPITGIMSVCVGQTTTLTDGITGGTWVSSNVGMATVVSTSGVVTGVTASAPVISYKLASGCVTNATVTVLPLAAITGIASVCQGQATTLADATTGGGTWSSSNTLMATVNSGIVTGTGAGTPTITFTSVAGCKATRPVTVLPLAPITGIMSVCVGQTTTLNDAVAGGTWVSSNVGMARVGVTTGVVTGVSASAPVISYKLASGCVSSTTVIVNACGKAEDTSQTSSVAETNGISDVRLFPNPNKGAFNIKGSLSTQDDAEVSIEITDMLGQIVYRNTIIAQAGNINEQVQLNNSIANAMYIVIVRSGTETKMFHIVVEK